MQPGKIKEGRTYIRWEDPILGINGEGRVSPVIPGCHQDIPDGTMPIKAMVKAGQILGKTPFTDEDHARLINRDIRLAAFMRFILPFLILIMLGFTWWILKLKK